MSKKANDLMQAVIGTAGHVDHGKSSLIEALTGIHPSHLPQELQRGLTIDLGFAHMAAPDGGKIGIIDVPGHERFIRNMVSGVWGLDMVLFVIAADAGWATLSEEHLRVIAAMGIRQYIIVLTKCDLVDEKRLHEVEEEALERFLTMTDTLPEVVYTSAHSGKGIDGLKTVIYKKLAQLPSRQNLSAGAHLYVDRVFSVSGIGTTVTGTLRGDGVDDDEVLTLLPGGQKVRVRSLQSYHEQLPSVVPYSRVAIALKQVNKKLVSRGSCLVANANDVTVSTDWIVQLNPRFSEMKRQGEVEIALGTTHTQAQCYVFADGQLARLQLKEPVPAFWGQPMLLIQHGGSHIIGAGRLVWMQSLDKKMRLSLQNALPSLEENCDASSKLKLQLALKGHAPIDQNVSAPEGIQTIGLWWVTKPCVQDILKQCNDFLLQSVNALSTEELGRRSGYPSSLIDAITTQQCDASQWQRIEGGVVSNQTRSDGSLPADQAQLLTSIQAAGIKGLIVTADKQPGSQRLLRSLTERKLIVPTVDGMFFAVDTYNELVGKIMMGWALGDAFGVPEARDRTELGRKQLIPVFNRMEKDGWLKRVGDNRVVCKVWQ
ncbi:MAG: selenocysteine-specific translation elongation factor [Saezia sp.]